MKRAIYELNSIANNHQITKDTDNAFLFHLQGSILLALKEQGKLNLIQYRYAEEKRKKQGQKHD